MSEHRLIVKAPDWAVWKQHGVYEDFGKAMFAARMAHFSRGYQGYIETVFDTGFMERCELEHSDYFGSLSAYYDGDERDAYGNRRDDRGFWKQCFCAENLFRDHD